MVGGAAVLFGELLHGGHRDAAGWMKMCENRSVRAGDDHVTGHSQVRLEQCWIAILIAHIESQQHVVSHRDRFSGALPADRRSIRQRSRKLVVERNSSVPR